MSQQIFILSAGAYDGYRAPFSNTPNSGYGQTQFNTPRDYSNSTYQRVRIRLSLLVFFLNIFSSSTLYSLIIHWFSINIMALAA